MKTVSDFFQSFDKDDLRMEVYAHYYSEYCNGNEDNIEFCRDASANFVDDVLTIQPQNIGEVIWASEFSDRTKDYIAVGGVDVLRISLMELDHLTHDSLQRLLPNTLDQKELVNRLMNDENCGILQYKALPFRDDIMTTPWEEVLGLKVFDETIHRIGKYRLVHALLKDMTIWGFWKDHWEESISHDEEMNKDPRIWKGNPNLPPYVDRRTPEEKRIDYIRKVHDYLADLQVYMAMEQELHSFGPKK